RRNGSSARKRYSPAPLLPGSSAVSRSIKRNSAPCGNASSACSNRSFMLHSSNDQILKTNIRKKCHHGWPGRRTPQWLDLDSTVGSCPSSKRKFIQARHHEVIFFPVASTSVDDFSLKTMSSGRRVNVPSGFKKSSRNRVAVE